MTVGCWCRIRLVGTTLQYKVDYYPRQGLWTMMVDCSRGNFKSGGYLRYNLAIF